MITKRARIIISRRQTKSLITASLLLLVFVYSSAESHTPQFPEINLIRSRTVGGYPYLNGGISHAEQQFMERAAEPYNLKLVFASRRGTPVTPAFVLIGANDGGRVERIALGAPWFYIRLPPGGYTILARFTNQLVLVRDVNIGQSGRKTYVMRGD